ncbi:uncharacterized protein LOC119398850 [Rhipicephalus sanguineus]|uniref:uncharacterized protein LOC119398850 n=1 Tax=Rhipicephalus sanguineus TaxID=34632 RepID=UPI0018941E2E|nr:uncharacterized protein LOC119398850 [Rhipicephalus sanguineus]
MDVDYHGRMASPAASAAATSRKRTGLYSDSDSEGTHVYSLSSEEPSDDEFELVMSRKAKRRNTRTSSSSSTLNERAQRRPVTNTILFIPEVPDGNMKRLNRQSVSALLERLVPNEITDIRVHTRKNVMAIDVSNAAALNTLRNVTELDGMKVRSYIPLGSSVVTGVIYDVDTVIPSSDFNILVKPANEASVIAKVFRLGNSHCLKMVFKGDSLPPHVKVGHFRHPLRPFIPKPLQCYNSMKMGHVKSVCEDKTVCSRCAETHSADECKATAVKCSNCDGSHAASSKECPKIQTEIAMLKEMVRDHSSYREAAKTVRKRRHRRRSSLKNATDSASAAPLHRPSFSPPLPPRPKAASAANKPTNSIVAVESVWPTLPKSQPPASSKFTSKAITSEPAADKLPEEDKEVITMFERCWMPCESSAAI